MIRGEKKIQAKARINNCPGGHGVAHCLIVFKTKQLKSTLWSLNTDQKTKLAPKSHLPLHNIVGMPISIVNGKLRTPPHVQVQSSTYIYNETLANKQNFYKGSHGKRLPGKPQIKSTRPAAVILRPKGCRTSNKGLSHFGQRAAVAERVAESLTQNYVSVENV